MKILAQLLVVTVTVVMASATWAGNVTIPNTFTDGTPAVAAEVNGNFSAVEVEVDDNAADIAGNTAAIATKQNIVGGLCPTGQSIRIINANGTVICEIDNDTTYTAGSGISIVGTTISKATQTEYYAISGLEFKPAFATQASEWHGYDISGQYGFPTLTGTKYLGHTVRLPNGATITEVTCDYYDSDIDDDINNVSFALRRRSFGSSTSTSTMASATVDPVPLVGLDDNIIRQVTDTTISYAIVDNASYAYNLTLMFGASANFTAASNSAIRSYGCRVGYTH